MDIEWFGQQLAHLNLSAALILIASSWINFLAALVFINPMISVTFVAEALSQLPSVENMPVTIALVMMLTWAVVIGSLPTKTSVMY